ncbi:hypothetical protein GCM10010358_39240 [Streptomyces minutiscleroticus]|uniref:Uncharacterized protein n=1 Tax=Streptomyces minutiscleroticus TaxID=68238 RepID=A0A918U1A5_9ACTN|nr:hypothetical protein GCM10010358_39240 [Streptomyces minutiscleroticus]
MVPFRTYGVRLLAPCERFSGRLGRGSAVVMMSASRQEGAAGRGKAVALPGRAWETRGPGPGRAERVVWARGCGSGPSSGPGAEPGEDFRGRGLGVQRPSGGARHAASVALASAVRPMVGRCARAFGGASCVRVDRVRAAPLGSKGRPLRKGA